MLAAMRLHYWDFNGLSYLTVAAVWSNALLSWLCAFLFALCIKTCYKRAPRGAQVGMFAAGIGFVINGTSPFLDGFPRIFPFWWGITGAILLKAGTAWHVWFIMTDYYQNGRAAVMNRSHTTVWSMYKLPAYIWSDAHGTSHISDFEKTALEDSITVRGEAETIKKIAVEAAPDDTAIQHVLSASGSSMKMAKVS